MLTNETISKLNEMHLGTMAAGFAAQLTDPQFQSLSFEERFSILVDAEWSARKSNRLTKLIKKADYSAPGASVEDISFLPERKLDQAQILRLASCTYIREAQNVIILGATGTGKTYLACALGMAANRNYYEVKYIRLPDLLVEIAMARATNTYQDLMRRYKKVPLLILDEWLLYSLKETEARDAWRKINSKDKELDGISSLVTMVKGLFRKDRLLAVMKDFVYFPDSSDKDIKPLISVAPARSCLMKIKITSTSILMTK